MVAILFWFLCVYVCVCVHAHAHIYILCVCICVCMHAPLHLCVYLCVCMHVCAICVCACIHVCLCAYTCVCLCACVRVYLFMLLVCVTMCVCEGDKCSGLCFGTQICFHPNNFMPTRSEHFILFPFTILTMLLILIPAGQLWFCRPHWLSPFLSLTPPGQKDWTASMWTLSCRFETGLLACELCLAGLRLNR